MILNIPEASFPIALPTVRRQRKLKWNEEREGNRESASLPKTKTIVNDDLEIESVRGGLLRRKTRPSVYFSLICGVETLQNPSDVEKLFRPVWVGAREMDVLYEICEDSAVSMTPFLLYNNPRPRVSSGVSFRQIKSVTDAQPLARMRRCVVSRAQIFDGG